MHSALHKAINTSVSNIECVGLWAPPPPFPPPPLSNVPVNHSVFARFLAAPGQ